MFANSFFFLSFFMRLPRVGLGVRHRGHKKVQFHNSSQQTQLVETLLVLEIRKFYQALGGLDKHSLKI